MKRTHSLLQCFNPFEVIPYLPLYFHQIMQQIGNFDQELNYVPFRYRHRSRTNPKEQPEAAHAGRYSRGKGERFNPEKYREGKRNVVGDRVGREGKQQDEWIGAESHPLKEEAVLQSKGQVQVPTMKETDHNEASKQKANRQMAWNPFQHDHFNDELTISPLSLAPLPHKPQEEQFSNELYNKEIADLAHKISVEMNSVFNESELQEIKDTILKNIQQTQRNENVGESIVKMGKQGHSNVSTEKELDEHISMHAKEPQIAEQIIKFNRTPKRMEVAPHPDNKRIPPSKEVQYKRSESNPTCTSMPKKEKINFKSQLLMKQQSKHSQFIRSPHQPTTLDQIQSNMNSLLMESKPSPFHTLYNHTNHKQEQQSKKTGNIKQKLKERNLLAKEWKKKQIEKKIEIEPQQPQQQPAQPVHSQILSKFSRQTPNEAMRIAKEAKSREKARQPIAATGGYSISKTSALGFNSKNGYLSKIKKEKAQQIPIKIQQQRQDHQSPIQHLQSSPAEQEQSPSQCSIGQYSTVKKAKEQSPLASPVQPQTPQVNQEPVDRQFQLSYIGSSIKHSQPKPQDPYSPSPKDRSLSHHQQRSSRVNSDYFSHPTSYVHQNPSPIGNSSIIKSEQGDQLLKMMAINSDLREISSLVIEDNRPMDNSDFNQEFIAIIDSNESQYSPNSDTYSMSSGEIQRQFEEKVGEFELGELFPREGGEVAEELRQINEDSQVVLDGLKGKGKGKDEIEDILLIGKDEPIEDSTPQISKLALDRLNQPHSSPLLLHRHLHPKAALERFKRSKHGSADPTPTPRSSRFNFSLSLLKQSIASSLQQRWRDRMDRNLPRFKTRMNEYY